MTYYDYLYETCGQLLSMIDNLHLEEACTRAEGDDVSADAIATEAFRLNDIYDAVWDKTICAASHDA